MFTVSSDPMFSRAPCLYDRNHPPRASPRLILSQCLGLFVVRLGLDFLLCQSSRSIVDCLRGSEDLSTKQGKRRPKCRWPLEFLDWSINDPSARDQDVIKSGFLERPTIFLIYQTTRLKTQHRSKQLTKNKSRKQKIPSSIVSFQQKNEPISTVRNPNNLTGIPPRHGNSWITSKNTSTSQKSLQLIIFLSALITFHKFWLSFKDYSLRQFETVQFLSPGIFTDIIIITERGVAPVRSAGSMTFARHSIFFANSSEDEIRFR